MVKKLEVSRDELQRIVDELESQQTFPNPSALWKAVEETAWAKAHQPRPVAASVAYDRAKELGIQYKTRPAKRGLIALTEEQRAAMLAARKNRKPRSEKMKAYASTFTGMRNCVTERFLPLVAQAEKGSLRAAIKLKCLDCSNYQPSEIKECAITVCSLFPHRPYQRSLEKVDDAVEQESDAAEQEDDANE